MPYSPVSAANGILELSFRDGIPVDPMKLQKLLYFMHGYYIASSSNNAPLLEERFEAWKLGPVLPSVYHKLKKFRGSPIVEFGTSYNPSTGLTVPAAPPETDNAYAAVRDYVWKTYGRWDPMALSSLTHMEGYAWDRTLKENPGILGPQINNDYILSDFSKLVAAT